ncbi:hypothetical protein QYF61_000500 [Mycteria americana]|uniref:Rna-directed dna polymerase from mobile element jockey-like n=1 Tax=Mycteria americana TaxID=33587 RepID=A0AAN7PUM3_MYCAM|nr:hypothetical protein QYF61_000500 [Mycteria americana]
MTISVSFPHKQAILKYNFNFGPRFGESCIPYKPQAVSLCFIEEIGFVLQSSSDTPEGTAAIQRDLHRLKKWADRDLMQFNTRRCKVLHLGRNNPRHQYLPGADSLVRPHLECWVQCWTPQYKRDTDILERVQQRATRMREGLEHLSYVERLRELGCLAWRREGSREGFHECV